MTYESIYSGISSKEEMAKKQLGELKRPTRFRTQQFVSPGAWAEEKKIRQKLAAQRRHKREAAGETRLFLGELGEQRAKVEEYEREGYDVEPGDEGYKFTKKTYVPGKRVRVGTRTRSLLITWVDAGGKVHVVGVKSSRYDKFKKDLPRQFPGSRITKVTTVGGGALYKTEKGHYATRDVVLAEAKPIYEKVTVDMERDEKQIGDITVRHIGMDETVDLGFGKQKRVIQPTSDAELAMIRQSDISRVDVAQGIAEARIVGYKKIERHREKLEESFRYDVGDPGKASVKFLSSFALSAPQYFLSLPSIISGEHTAMDVYSSIDFRTERAMKRGGIPGVFLESYTDPMGTGRFFTEIAASSYLMGAGVGALKKTAFGAKTLVRSRGVWESTKHGRVFTKLFKPEVGKPIWQVTRSQAVEMGIAGYYGKDIPSAMKDKPWETLTSLAITLPFVGATYKAGHRYGGKMVERWGGMSRVKGVQRVQQKAIYDSIDIVQDLKGVPKKKGFVFDLTTIKKIGKTKAEDIGRFVRGERWKRTHPTIMGSTSMEFFDVPYSPLPKTTQSWITKRLIKGKHKVGLIGDRLPMDIDIGLRDTFFSDVGKRFYAMFPKKKFSHIIERTHGTPKAGRELYPGFGGFELPKVKVKVKNIVTKLRAMKPTEQFFRTSRSIAPSEWVDYKTPSGIVQSSQEYRLGKDVQRWWNIGQATAKHNLESMFYKSKAKALLDAMTRYAEPTKHRIPSVSIGERFIKKVGGDVKPISYGVDKMGVSYPIYPSSVYPSHIIPYALPSCPSKKYYPSKPSVVYKYPTKFKKPFYPTKIISPIISPIIPPYEHVPYTPMPPPSYSPPPRKTTAPPPPVIIFGKDVTLPKPPAFKFDKPMVTKRKKKTHDDVFPSRRKIRKGLPKIEVPEYKFRKFDIGQLFKGVKT